MSVKYLANVGIEAVSINNVDLASAFGAGDEFALSIPTQGTPSIAWQTVITGTITSITVLLEASLDGTNWFTIDSSSSIVGELRRISGAPYRFVRINNSAIVDGAGDELTASFVYSNTIREVVEDREISGIIETAEMNNLFSVPKIIIADSLVVGQWLFPYRITWRKEAGTLYTMNGSAGLQLYSGAPQTSILLRIAAAGLLDTAIETRGCFFNIPASTTATVFSAFSTVFGGATFAKGLQWGCPTANFSGGVGRLFYKIRYFVEQDAI